MALSAILTDETILIGPMRKFLDNDSERIPSGNLALMLSRLQELEELRDSLVDGVAVPHLKEDWGGKIALKVDMASYLMPSGCDKLSSGEYPYPDPWLLGMKAAINTFYAFSGRKLLPSCLLCFDDDEDSGDGTETINVGRALAGLPPLSSIVPQPLPKPQEYIHINQNDDEETSVLSVDSD